MEPHVIELNFREMSGDKCGYCHICGDKTIYEYDSVKFTYHFKDKKTYGTLWTLKRQNRYVKSVWTKWKRYSGIIIKLAGGEPIGYY